MTERNYEFRFELKPGKFIYVPTEESIKQGKKIVKDLLKNWQPAEYFYHFGKRGGHVASMRPHVPQTFKASIDLKGFFSSVTRTKVQRVLKGIGYSNRYALDLAEKSCVERGGRKFLPYGFVQSMALATLVVEKSNLGRKISELRSNGVRITMYVDDILLSCRDEAGLIEAYSSLIDAISRANLTPSADKSSHPARVVEAFNCTISAASIKLTNDRMEQFKEQLKWATPNGRKAILDYVGVIDKAQRTELLTL
jgi:hypothetical protein